MKAASIASSRRDNERQRSFPDEIICIRASSLTPLTCSQRTLISETSSRPLSSHLLSAVAELVAHTAIAIPHQSARMGPAPIKKFSISKTPCAGLTRINRVWSSIGAVREGSFGPVVTGSDSNIP